MTLPDIFPPAGLPEFLIEGHSASDTPQFAPVQFGAGPIRMRRVRTLSHRVIRVAWFLERWQLAAAEEWFESTLEAGSLPFVASVASQDAAALEQWRAVWISWQVEALHKGRGVVRGALLVTAYEPSSAAPAPAADHLLLESGDDLLLESGDLILVE
jgi:hypothetical protein